MVHWGRQDIYRIKGLYSAPRLALQVQVSMITFVFYVIRLFCDHLMYFILIKVYVSYKNQCFILFMLFKFILCFYYQNFVCLWDQTGDLHRKWIMFVIPIFVTLYLFKLIMNMDTLLYFPDLSHPSSFSARIVECIISAHTARHSGDTFIQPSISNSLSCLFINSCIL